MKKRGGGNSRLGREARRQQRGRKVCEVPSCESPAKRWPGQPAERYCDEHLFQINHAVVRGDAAKLFEELGVVDRTSTAGESSC